jgi:hypothetical protein
MVSEKLASMSNRQRKFTTKPFVVIVVGQRALHHGMQISLEGKMKTIIMYLFCLIKNNTRFGTNTLLDFGENKTE